LNPPFFFSFLMEDENSCRYSQIIEEEECPSTPLEDDLKEYGDEFQIPPPPPDRTSIPDPNIRSSIFRSLRILL